MSDGRLRHLERVWRLSPSWPAWSEWAREARRLGDPVPMDFAREARRWVIRVERATTISARLPDAPPDDIVQPERRTRWFWHRRVTRHAEMLAGHSLARVRRLGRDLLRRDLDSLPPGTPGNPPWILAAVQDVHDSILGEAEERRAGRRVTNEDMTSPWPTLVARGRALRAEEVERLEAAVREGHRRGGGLVVLNTDPGVDIEYRPGFFRVPGRPTHIAEAIRDTSQGPGRDAYILRLLNPGDGLRVPSLRAIADQVGCSPSTVARVRDHAAAVRRSE